MISEKIKALLSLKGKKANDCAKYLAISPQSLRNKFYRETLTVDDLIKISLFTDCPLVMEVKGDRIVIDEKLYKHKNDMSPADLIKISLFIGSSIYFEVTENQRIIFDESDLHSKKTEGNEKDD